MCRSDGERRLTRHGARPVDVPRAVGRNTRSRGITGSRGGLRPIRVVARVHASIGAHADRTTCTARASVPTERAGGSRSACRHRRHNHRFDRTDPVDRTNRGPADRVAGCGNGRDKGTQATDVPSRTGAAYPPTVPLLWADRGNGAQRTRRTKRLEGADGAGPVPATVYSAQSTHAARGHRPLPTGDRRYRLAPTWRVCQEEGPWVGRARICHCARPA